MIAREVRANWAAKNKRHEGRIPWLYLDRKGLLTVAVGILVKSLLQLYGYRWISRATGAPATHEEIAAAREAIMDPERLARLKEYGATESRKIPEVYNIYLPEEELDRIVLERFDAFDAALCKTFPDLPAWPIPAQYAVMSMAWAVGTDLPRTYPKMTAALRQRDFLGARDECHISEVGNEGVAERNVWNKALYLEAAQLGATVPEPPPTEPIPEGEVLALVADTLDGTVKDLLAEGYRAR